MTVAVALAARLPDKVVESEQDQCAAGDPRKDSAGPLARLDAEPDHQDAEHGGEQDVARAAERHHHQSLALAPALPAPGHDEWQPVGRDRRVGEGDDEACRHDRQEEGLIHRVVLLLAPLSASGSLEQESGIGRLRACSDQSNGPSIAPIAAFPWNG